jgi:hypothetical protein
VAAFRKRFLPQLKALFVQILMVARTLKLLKVGNVSLDGSKVKANASRHRALSYGHANKIEAQLKAEVEQLLRLAEQADRRDLPDGMDVPAELARRETRLAAIREAKTKIEARAQERFEAEQKVYEAKVAARRERQKKSGKRPGGKPPAPPVGGPRETDQVSLTDEQSRIMKAADGGFEQAYNAQALTDVETKLILGAFVTQQPGDVRQIEPALERLGELPETLGKPQHLLADTGYFSKDNVRSCEAAGVTPLIAMKRERHHRELLDRFAPEPLPQDPVDAVRRLDHRLATQDGKALYARRKTTSEPVFGVIKHVMGFRQFLMRGIESVSGEWSLVSIAWNLRRMHTLMRAT